MSEHVTRRELRICDPCFNGNCEACRGGACLCACQDGRGQHGVNHFCAACGQCLCDCKNCAVAFPCCCRACWKATAPRPPVKSTHHCTCAPAGVTA